MTPPLNDHRYFTQYIISPRMWLDLIVMDLRFLISVCREHVMIGTLLTHWGRSKLSPFRRRYFQVHFLMKMYEFRLIFHWTLFLMFELTIFHYWFIGAKPLSEPIMVGLLTNLCVTRAQWFKGIIFVSEEATSFETHRLRFNVTFV